ncbi:MAG: VCBS repeat-containing protein [Phycisphaerales bacterium]|nr:VCBS repeat-containing protein [Phycisphaerales bacterium]
MAAPQIHTNNRTADSNGRMLRTTVSTLVAIAAAAIGLRSPVLAQCPLTLAAPSGYLGDEQTSSVGVGDFNSDGIPDLAVPIVLDHAVSILLGTPNGTFQAPTSYAAGVEPTGVVVADFNDDGLPDLAVARYGGNSVSVLLNNPAPGAGTFQSPVNYPVAGNQNAIAAGDFNGDGAPDLAVTNRNTNNVSILLCNANGTFQPAAHYAAGAAPRATAVGDFNADTALDLAVLNFDSSNVSILFGNPFPAGGTFGPPTNYVVGESPTAIAVGDLNGDDVLDLAVASGISGSVIVLPGSEAPNSGTFQTGISYVAGDLAFSLMIADLNADGMADLVAPAYFSNVVAVLLGNPGGTLGTAITHAAGANPGGGALEDFDLDGRPDLAFTNIAGISVLRNTSYYPAPTITQQPTAHQFVAAGASASLSVVADGHGNEPVTYQWRRSGQPLADGDNISGATSATLTFNPALAGDTASYDVQVGTPACAGGLLTRTSSAAVIAVIDPCAGLQPIITQHPVDQLVATGASAAFTVAAAAPPGTGLLTYQWRRGGIALFDGSNGVSGANTPILTISPVALAANGTAYDCVVSSQCGSATSNPAGLGVFDPCPADFNHSGAVTSADITAFLQAWFAAIANGCP